MRRLQTSSAGYSLVEMMTVLMVVGVLMAIAAPAIQNHIALQEIRGTAQEVVQTLRGARDEALNEGVPRYVFFDPAVTPQTYRVYRYSGGNWVAETGAEELPNSVTFADGDVSFPTLQTTLTGLAQPVPENAAYFDTRGKYPFQAGAPSSYDLTLHGGLGKVVVLTLHRSTGQVTGL
jgi:prepilin-type N-terminal cleavage/methylation domain-containing protein